MQLKVIAALAALAASVVSGGCSSSPDFPNPKPGAWEIVSTHKFQLEGAPQHVAEAFQATHPSDGKSKQIYLCITDDPAEIAFRKSPRTSAGCSVTIISQSATERSASLNCDHPVKSESSYNFKFSNDDNYTESITGVTEGGISKGERYRIRSTLTSTAKYLGPDCQQFGAKKGTGLTSLLAQLQ